MTSKKNASKENLINKTARYIFIFVLVFTLCGCVRWHCPAFPEDLTLYAPYSEDQHISFTDNANDTVSLVVCSIHKTKSKKIEYGCKCTCDLTSYSMNLKYCDDSILYFVIAIPFSDGTGYTTDEIDRSQTKYVLNDIPDNSGYYPEFAINNPASYESYFKNDTILFVSKSNTVIFDSIQVVRGIGFAGFRTLDGRHWHLIR